MYFKESIFCAALEVDLFQYNNVTELQIVSVRRVFLLTIQCLCCIGLLSAVNPGLCCPFRLSPEGHYTQVRKGNC